MAITQAVLSPAGPHALGALATLTAYVDLGGATPDPSYAGWTAVLAFDMRNDGNAASAALSGPISATVDGTGVATFTGLTVVANAAGGSQAYLVCAFIPPGTWSDFYTDSFTAADGTTLSAHDNGALTGAVTGHVPDSSPNTFIWTDYAWYADIVGNSVQITSPSHGNSAYINGSYAWSTDVPANNNQKDCRVAVDVTLDFAALGGAGDLYGYLGLMPNFDAYSDYECNWTFTDTAFWGWEVPSAINLIDYRSSFKQVIRPMVTPANATPFTYEMQAFGTWLFVLVDGTYELGTLNDPIEGNTAAMGPYLDASADNASGGTNHMQINLDNFATQTFVESGGGEEPPAVNYGDPETLTMSVCAGRTQNLRVEGRVSRGGASHLTVGNNIIYRSAGYHSGDSHWAFGCIHSSDSTVTLRYRYCSGGNGEWTTLKSDYSWSIDTAQKLIVELDGDVHTFRIADAYGHDERILGRIVDSRAPGQRVGWHVRGTVAQDSLDNFRVMDFDSLVRIKYRLSPDDDRLQIPLWEGTVTSGNASLITDPSKHWSINELVGAYLRIVGGPGIGSDSKIVANSETSITPEVDFLATPTSASTYLVYDKYFTGTERLQFWRERGLKEPKYLYYHGERRGAAPEPEQRMLIDANHVAEIVMSISQVASGPDEGVMRVIVEPDDDVATWELYMRKDAWPTVAVGTANPDQFAEPDPDYRRYRGSTDLKEQDIEVSNGIWYVVAAPYDTNGYRGPTVGLFLEIVSDGSDPGDGTGGGGGGDGGGGTGEGGDDSGGGIKKFPLANLKAFHPSESGLEDIIVYWEYSTSATFPIADATVDVSVFELKYPTRVQWVVRDYPVDSQDYHHVTLAANSGNVREQFLFDFGTKNIDPWTTIQFNVVLKINGVVNSSASVSYHNYGQIVY